MNGRRGFLKVALAAVVSSVVTGVGAWGVIGSRPAETVTVEKTVTSSVTVTETQQPLITCPINHRPYVWTPIGSRSENFNWICLEDGHRWSESYPEDVYDEWRKGWLTSEYVRDYTVLYLREIEKITLPDPLTLTWSGGLVIPEGQEYPPPGYSTFVYRAGGLVVTVGYAIVLPENTVYEIKVESQGTMVWEGQLSQREFKQKMITKLASVNDIEILLLESFPVQVNVVARGELPDSCTEVYEITKRREGNTFFVTITTSRPADAVCAQVITPFEEVIPLDAVGLKAGSYTVDVNGVRDTFELQIDNIRETEKVEVEVGQEFTITLESNPTTGYQWQLAKPLDEGTLKLIGSEYKPPETELVGAGGEEVWTFGAVDRGTAEISLKYVRPWEKDAPPEKEQTFTIIVK